MTQKRRVQPIGLVASLILAPGLAGLIGGLLVFLGTLPLVFEGGYTPGPDGDLAAGVIGASLLSMTVGVMFSYVIGTPFIVGAWLCVHLFTARRTIHLLPALSLAGALFSWLLFGGFLRQLDASVPASAVVMAFAPVISGALAGLCVGALISGLGYAPVIAAEQRMRADRS